jgi:hypothetical protein
MSKGEILSLTDRLSANTVQPLQYIRGLSTQAIHSSALELLARKSEGDKNFCFKIKAGDKELILLAEYLPWDSQHFGFGISKISYLLNEENQDPQFISDSLKKVVSEIQQQGVRYILTSHDLRKNKDILAFNSAGFFPIEYRVNYHRELKSFSYPKRFQVRLANDRDLTTLEATAGNTKNPYDRFFGDPTLDSNSVQELLRLWVRNSVTTSFSDGVLVPDMIDPKAFCSFKLHQNSWADWGVKLAQPILAAVSPELSGWYLKIMSELTYYLREHGADRAYMTTQLANHAVIRTWEALGYSYGSSECVLRWTDRK